MVAELHRRLHVGLGSNTEAEITIVWPNGSTDTHTDVAANELYRAVQGGDLQLVLDTDGDQVSSYEEALQGSDPEDALDYPDTDRDGVPGFG